VERLGLTIGLEGASLKEAVELCRVAEKLGYTDVWSAEVGGPDGLSPLAALATVTDNVRLGTAILPVFTRPPALVAMGAASIQSLSGGRFVLGLGTSSSIITEKWMGGSFQQPLVRLREYVEAVRAILAGQKLSVHGDTITVEGFRLQLDPGAPVPIYMAALGPAACRLAGAIADGVVFFLKTPDGVRQALGWVAEGAEGAGRDPQELDCLIRVSVAVDEDEEVLTFLARKLVSSYAVVDVYNRSLREQGFAAEAEAIAKAWTAGDRDEATLRVTDEMIEKLFISGDARTCAQRLQEFRAAGVKTPVLLPTSVAGDPAERSERVRATVAALAPGTA
jgi:probable F420-dependent oxidoreductase